MDDLDSTITPQVSEYSYEGLHVKLETSGHTIDEVLEAFENVLRGQGYCFKGNIQIIDEWV